MEEYIKTGSKAMRNIFWIFLISFVLLFIYHKPKGFDTIYLTIAFLPLIYLVYYIHVRLFPMGEIQLIILSSFLAEMGLIMIYRVAPDLIIKQLAWIFIGYVFYFVSSFVSRHYEVFYNFKYGDYIYLTISFILLLSTLVLGKDIGGSKNWLTFGSISLQPSELVKIIYIIFLARFLKNRRTTKDIIIIGVITLIFVGILVIEKDLGTALLFYLTTTFMIFIATSSVIYTSISGLILCFGGIISYFIFNHVRVRIEAWLNPWMDVPGKTYQIAQSLFAIGAGGFFGTGLGMGHPEYIPVVASDFIFSAISEEFGMLGSVAVILVYLVIMYRGIRVALDAKDEFGALVAVGLTSMFSLQVFTIIGGVIKFIPLTGVTLPFVSYGGSSMIMSFLTLGMLNGIALREDDVSEQFEPQH